MFLFNSFHESPAFKLRRNFARSVFALFVMFCLSSVLLFTGCGTDEDDSIDLLVGTWTSAYGEKYNITSDKLAYDDGFGGGYAGAVKYVSAFSDTAGVIIIEYDADKKPTYYDSYENYGDPDHIVKLKGNFIGIYYKDLTPGVSIKMGGAYADGGAEEKTLDAAKKTFTTENESKYMTFYGEYVYSIN
jgi:hypothetical protein